MSLRGVREDKFAGALGLITVGAVVLRVAAAWFFDRRTGIVGDGVWYQGIARLLPDGIGFVEPLQYAVGRDRVASASHPPLYPIYLSAVDVLGLHSTLAHRVWSCLPGAGTVVLTGLIGREIASRRVGLVAAAIAAVSIPLAVQDVLLWSEGLFGFSLALVVLVAYRYARGPGLRNAIILAAAITFSSLVRAESAALFVVLLLPLVLRAEARWRQRLLALLVSVAVALVLVAPWLAYNAGRFEHPVGLSTGLGGLLASSNCDSTYSGPAIGGWGGLCGEDLPRRLPRDESKADLLFRSVGLRYVREHADRLPIVLPMRIARTFGVWRPVALTSGDLQLEEAGIRWVAYVAVAQYWVLAILGIAGVARLRRRRCPILPIAAPVVVVLFITVIGYGTMRFRIGLDVVLPVLAAVGLAGVRPFGAGTASAPPTSDSVEG